MDMECLRSLDNYQPMKQYDFIIPAYKDGVQNCILFSTKKNESIANLINHYFKTYTQIGKVNIMYKMIHHSHLAGNFYIENDESLFVHNSPNSIYFRHYKTGLWRNIFDHKKWHHHKRKITTKSEDNK
jgi:hypothetical protein